MLNLRNVRPLPRALAAFLVLLGIAALGHALVTSVRRRRHELAVLRAMGFTPRQTAVTIMAQAGTVAVVGLVVGIPLGVIFGRLSWRWVADATPLVFSPPIAIAVILLAVPVTIIVANLLAAGPADAAALEKALFPRDCARSYRYYALDVDDPVHVPEIVGRVRAVTARLNRALAITDESGPAYYPVTTTQRDIDQQVRRTVRPLAVALQVFGLVALLATLVLVAIAVGRMQRRSAPTDRARRALGMRVPARVLCIAAPSLVGIALGTVGAIGVAYVLSPIGPVGEVGRMVPGRGPSAPMRVLGVVTPVIAFVLVLVVVALAYATARRDTDTLTTPIPARLGRLRGALPPPVADGIGLAVGSRRWPLPAAAVIAVGALVAAGTFGANLGSLVDHPRDYGWPWQLGALTGGGYGSMDVATVRADLKASPDVASWDELGIAGATLDRHAVSLLYGARSLNLPVVAGRLPQRTGEVALGQETARRLHVPIGRRVRLDIQGDPVSARVVGTVVLPTLGQVLSDRTGPGAGAFLVVPANVMNGETTTFIGIHLRPGTTPRRALTALTPRFARWNIGGGPAQPYPAPVRPPEIVNADSMRSGPLVLAGVLGVALVTALVLSIGSTVAGRRRDHAIQRSLGYTARQIATSVHWHALTVVTIGISLGIPLGVVAGRLAWNRFADQLGIVGDATVPVALLVVVAIAAWVGAVLAAARPAWTASRRSPAAALRAS